MNPCRVLARIQHIDMHMKGMFVFGGGEVFPRVLKVGSALVFGLFAASGLVAAGPPSSPTDLVVTSGDGSADDSEEPQESQENPSTVSTGTLVSWTGFEYAVVVNSEGQMLGVVEELLVDLREGRVAFVSISPSSDPSNSAESKVLDARKLKWSIAGSDPEAGIQAARLRAQLDAESEEEALVEGNVSSLADSVDFLSLRDLVAQIKGVTEGGEVQLADCVVDLDDELAVIFQLRVGSSGSDSSVYANKLDWGGMQ